MNERDFVVCSDCEYFKETELIDEKYPELKRGHCRWFDTNVDNRWEVKCEEFISKNTGSGINFKSAVNYFQELSNLKKIPLSVLKSATAKTDKNNSEDAKSKQKKDKKSAPALRRMPISFSECYAGTITCGEGGREGPSSSWTRPSGERRADREPP